MSEDYLLCFFCNFSISIRVLASGSFALYSLPDAAATNAGFVSDCSFVILSAGEIPRSAFIDAWCSGCDL